MDMITYFFICNALNTTFMGYYEKEGSGKVNGRKITSHTEASIDQQAGNTGQHIKIQSSSDFYLLNKRVD